MAKRLFILIIVCLSVQMLNACSNQPADIDVILSGRSENWEVDICMVDQGTTRIVMGPRNSFVYPDTITIELSCGNEQITTKSLVIERPQNSYSISFPTIESAYKNYESLIFSVSYNGLSETIALHEDPS